MPTPKRVPKKNNKDDVEIQSFAIFTRSLQDGKSRFEQIGGKKEAIDGHVYFYTEKGEILGHSDKNGEYKFIPGVCCQVKGTSQDVTNYPCSIEFISYCFHSIEPIMFVFVNVSSEEVYFKLISKTFIQNDLGIQDPETHPKESKTISFNVSDLFTGDSNQLLDAFIHLSPNFSPQTKKELQSATPGQLEHHKNMITGILGEDSQKIFEMEALIFLEAPFDMTNLKSLRSKLNFTETEVNFYIEKLVAKEILTKVRDILSIADVSVGKSLLDELITKKGVEYVYG